MLSIVTSNSHYFSTSAPQILGLHIHTPMSGLCDPQMYMKISQSQPKYPFACIPTLNPSISRYTNYWQISKTKETINLIHTRDRISLK